MGGGGGGLRWSFLKGQEVSLPTQFCSKKNSCLCLSLTTYLSNIMVSTTQTLPQIRKEGNVLFNDALNTFYLWLYGVRHMVKDHSDSEKGNPLPPHGLLFPINSKGSFICTIPHTG